MYKRQLFYRVGRSVKPDGRQAQQWASRAAAGGSVPALLLLSRLMEEGAADRPDPAAAYALALRACEAADNDALREEASLREKELALRITQSLMTAARTLAGETSDTALLVEQLERGVLRTAGL